MFHNKKDMIEGQKLNPIPKKTGFSDGKPEIIKYKETHPNIQKK